jgi:hypothetical protein
MWIFKTLKIQRSFQDCSIILKLQKSFATHRWGKMYMMCLKISSLLYNKEKWKKNGYDLKLLSFKKMKHWIYKELGNFQKFIFIKQWWR